MSTTAFLCVEKKKQREKKGNVPWLHLYTFTVFTHLWL